MYDAINVNDVINDVVDLRPPKARGRGSYSIVTVSYSIVY